LKCKSYRSRHHDDDGHALKKWSSGQVQRAVSSTSSASNIPHCPCVTKQRD
jgi:hypothetical protein